MVISNSQMIYKGQLEFPNCILHIHIQLNTYHNGKKYYDISYTWICQNGNILHHPFYDDREFLDNSRSGDIVFKNSLSEKMIEFLVMDNSELDKHCGMTTALTYKKQIIKSLSMFWD